MLKFNVIIMKLQRIFLAINIPNSAKKELLSYREKWPELPARWVAPDNLHLTMLFLGNMSEKDLQELLLFSQGVAKKHNPFEIRISEIEYGPTEAKPRMIWANIQKEPQLTAFQKDIMQFKPDNKPFAPHLTLARLRPWEFQHMEPEEKPTVREKLSINVPVDSFEIMQSQLRSQGSTYTILQSISLEL